MKRLQRAAIILSLAENLKKKGSWCGETHIQKATIFLQELLGVPLEFEFIMYKHGPFSFDLSDEITAMRADLILKFQPQLYPYGPSLVPGDGSESLKENFPKTIGKYGRQIEFVADKLANKKVVELERIATAFFVTKREMTSGSLEDRAKEICKLKPHVSLDDAKAAVQIVDELTTESKEIRVQ